MVTGSRVAVIHHGSPWCVARVWHALGWRRAARDLRLGVGGSAHVHVFLVRLVVLAGARLPTGWGCWRVSRSFR
jgi:hypothetical protein